MKLTTISLTLLCAALPVLAGTFQAPEISPASGVAAFTLLSGGILGLRSRRAKR